MQCQLAGISDTVLVVTDSPIIFDMWTTLLLVNKIRHINASRHIVLRARIGDVLYGRRTDVKDF